MEPNATLEILKDALEEIEQAYDAGRKDLWALHNSDAERYCADLTAWLAKGGLQPDWLAHPRAAAFYLDRVWQGL